MSKAQHAFFPVPFSYSPCKTARFLSNMLLTGNALKNIMALLPISAGFAGYLDWLEREYC
ncbi:MAG: hypothetical protein D3903_04175 [Candidatus Electrothrix sp. GM3_4]|nr:hypothetical protein [Candidatus Electrothrix sp. GM3_4]